MHVLTKQETLLGRGAWAESSRENPRGLLCLVAYSHGFYGDRIHFQVVSGQPSCLYLYLIQLRILLGGACISQPRWIPEWNLPDVGRIYVSSLLLLAPPEFSQLVFSDSTATVLHRDLLLWDSSCKLSSCMVKASSFHQWLPNSARDISPH